MKVNFWRDVTSPLPRDCDRSWIGVYPGAYLELATSSALDCNGPIFMWMKDPEKIPITEEQKAIVIEKYLRCHWGDCL